MILVIHRFKHILSWNHSFHANIYSLWSTSQFTGSSTLLYLFDLYCYCLCWFLILSCFWRDMNPSSFTRLLNLLSLLQWSQEGLTVSSSLSSFIITKTSVAISWNSGWGFLSFVIFFRNQVKSEKNVLRRPSFTQVNKMRHEMRDEGAAN